jgi:hypothetical protein
MKRNLTEEDVNRIVKKVTKQNYSETNEGLGDTWTGVKGFFRGKGYHYTKNLSKLNNIAQDLSYSEKYLNKIKLKCENIADDAVKSKMKDDKSEHILDIANEIIQGIETYNTKMNEISKEIKKII